MYKYIVMGIWDVFCAESGRKFGVDSEDYETCPDLESAIRVLRIKVREEMDSEYPKIIGISIR